MKTILRIAILGGGPAGLFLFKKLLDSGRDDIAIDIFEKKKQLGPGMPYSHDGANDEHITNISDNEIPHLVTSIVDWIKTVDRDTLHRFKIDPDEFHEYEVLPRLLFGRYLAHQFVLLQQIAKEKGIEVNARFSCRVTDVADYPEQNITLVDTADHGKFEFDRVIVSTGHCWPLKHEGTIPGYFDSPYPPAKLQFRANHPVAIKGASLTAIDAIRTLAMHNGTFVHEDNKRPVFKLADDSPDFKIVMHSRNGLLPAIRFHLEESLVTQDALLSPEEIKANRGANEGFLQLDYVFEKSFKDSFRDKQPEIYEQIKDMRMEDFVTAMMDRREKRDAFELFEAEYEEAEQSIKRHESIYWKEMLAELSYVMNYPAKYFSAEDMLRLKKVLMPLISIVIAFVPQSSAEVILALHEADVLDLISVDDDSRVEPVEKGGIIYHYTDCDGQQCDKHYETFIDSVGQPPLPFSELPYKSLIDKHTVSPAKLQFRDNDAAREIMEKGNTDVEADAKGNYYLKVPGVTINDCFQVVDSYGAYNERIYMMAVPYIGGYNPDYSGLDFCDTASNCIAKSMLGS
ncbi:FAD-NAD(P)-binding protein [Mucilaginibacter gynuensis]|uniref:FAD-NAD(P)-binding protein n=1 Tax=Mucilaginibacter gynuensis TaxID=1302236 RepID=A0ABP8GDA5_9SPHI